MFKKVSLVGVLVFFIVSAVHASPVGVIGVKKDKSDFRIQLDQDPVLDGKLFLNVGALYDGVFEREMESNEEADFNVAAAEIALEYDKMIKAYVTLGGAFDTKYKYQSSGSDIQFNFADNFIWGVGIATRRPLLKVVDVIADVNYRQFSGLDVDSIDVDGVNYSGSSLTGIGKGKWQEWGVSLGVIKDLGMFSPYAGVKYSDAKASGRGTASGTTYEVSRKSDNNVGVFVGAILNPMDSVDINVQGRFVDETALTASASYKF